MPKHAIHWHDIYFAIRSITDQLQKTNFIPDVIVGVGRGGLIPATLLAYKLDVKKIYNFAVQSYSDEMRQTIRVIQTTGYDIFDAKGKKVLIVDDLSDSGHTLRYIKEKLAHDLPEDEIRSATLFTKDKTTFIPDFYLREYHHDTWLVFPWEYDDASA